MHHKALLAEGLGTFMLVLIGPGAVAVASLSGWFAGLGIALAFGGVVWLMIGLFGAVSGAHINPAVTLGFRMCGAIDTSQAVKYLGVQFVGALLAGWVLIAAVPQGTDIGVTATRLSWPAAFLIELALTAGLMWVILLIVNYPVKNTWLAGAGIGAWVFLAAWLAGPLTGASMNPARSFGPAVAASDYHLLWLYFAAPVCGAGVGLFFCRVTGTGNDCCRSRVASDAL